MTPIAKRSFLAGLASLLGAPAVVHAENIMPVKRPLVLPPSEVILPPEGFVLPDDVILRLGGGDLMSGHVLLGRWVAGVRDVIEAERRMQADLRAVLDNTNKLAGWRNQIQGAVRLADRTISVKHWA